MTEENEFRKWHAYRRLAIQGRAPHIMCEYDDLPLVSNLGLDDMLVLWCPACHNTIVPGVGMWKGIEAHLTENGKLYD